MNLHAQAQRRLFRDRTQRPAESSIRRSRPFQASQIGQEASETGSQAFQGSRFGHDFSRVRIHADSSAPTLRRAPDLGVAKPKYTRADKSTVCPHCACSEPQTRRINQMRTKAAEIFTRADAALGDGQEAITELFEETFGKGSATEKNVENLRRTLRGAAAYLNNATPDEVIHCDSTNASAGCNGTGADAFHEAGHTVLCGAGKRTTEMLEPPTVEPVTKQVVHPSSSGSETTYLNVEDKEATKKKQMESNQTQDALLVSVLGHEAVHQQLSPMTIDVYRGERLHGFLGSGGKSPVDLSPIALQNPDSIVSFALRSLSLGAEGNDLLARPQAALTVSETQSGDLSIRPILGRRNAKLAVTLAQEAIEQAEKSIVSLRSGVASAQGMSVSWGDFIPPPGPVLSLLQDLDVDPSGRKTSTFTTPGAPALKRLGEILAGLSRLRQGLLEKKTVLGRRFLLDRPQRVEIAIPEWREFRGLPIDQQVLRILESLVRGEPKIRSLARFIFEHARELGGFDKLGTDKT